jgi:hypothetical protein
MIQTILLFTLRPGVTDEQNALIRGFNGVAACAARPDRGAGGTAGPGSLLRGGGVPGMSAVSRRLVG